MSESLQTYKPSGKYSLNVFLLCCAALFFAAPIAGLAYAYLLWLIPYNLLKILAWVLACILLVQIIKPVLIKGKVRNTKIAFWLSILIGVVFSYFHWAVWLYLNLEYLGETYQIVDTQNDILAHFILATDPFEMLSIANEIRDIQYSGWMIWIGEFLGFMFTCWVFAAYKSNYPFSEDDQEWHEEWTSPSLIHIPPYAFKKAILASDLTFLEQIEVAPESQFDYSKVKLFMSESGPDYLTLDNYKATKSKSGTVSFKRKSFMELAAISKKMTEAILKLENKKALSTKEATEIMIDRESEKQAKQQEEAVRVAKQKEEEKAIEVVNETQAVKIIPDTEIIESPILGIKISQTNSSGSLLYALLMFAAGIMFFSFADDMMEDRTITIIGGLMFTVGGALGIIGGLKKVSVPNNKLMIKITPSFIFIAKEVSNLNEDSKIPLNLLQDAKLHVSDVSASLEIIFKENVRENRDSVSIDINGLKIERHSLMKELVKFVNKPVEERKVLLKDWLRRRPTLSA